MPGPVADYVNKTYHPSPEFGSVWTANVLLPDGSLGMAERRSHFEFAKTADGRCEAILADRVYLHHGGHIVGIRELGGPTHRRTFGPFPTLGDAQAYASEHIRDYRRTAAEEKAYAVRYQQNKDYNAVHGKRLRDADVENTPQLKEPERIKQIQTAIDQIKQATGHEVLPDTIRFHVREECQQHYGDARGHNVPIQDAIQRVTERLTSNLRVADRTHTKTHNREHSIEI